MAMRSPRGRRLLLLSLAGVAVMAVVVLVRYGYSPIRERWYLHRLRSHDAAVRRAAFDRLRELDSRYVSVIVTGRGADLDHAQSDYELGRGVATPLPGPVDVDLIDFPARVKLDDWLGYYDPPRHEIELPDFVRAPAGELTLWADYKSVLSERIALYLVNRTAVAVAIPHQDGHHRVKLEGELTESGWIRAQPHYSSSCGNSYGATSLEPGTFLRLLGWAPESGKRCRVRYRVYGHIWSKDEDSENGNGAKLVSNVGWGSVHHDSIVRARFDDLAVHGADFEGLRRFLLNPGPGPSDLIESAQSHAVGRLEHEAKRVRGGRRRSIRIIERFIDSDRAGAAALTNAYSVIRVLALNSWRRRAQELALGNDLLRITAFLHSARSDAAPFDFELFARFTSHSNGSVIDHAIESLAQRWEYEEKDGDSYDLLRRELARIASDPGYAPRHREAARLRLVPWEFGGRLSVNVDSDSPAPSPSSDRAIVSKRVRITLTNDSNETISFDLSRPTDRFRFYVSRRDELNDCDHSFFVPRPNIVWNTAPGIDATTVTIAPRRSWSRVVSLEKYFELPERISDEALRLHVVASIPGVTQGAVRVADMLIAHTYE